MSWTTKKEEKIKKCVEKFDEILQREAAVRRAKKQECRKKKRQKTK
jgi:hypothetical protein